MGSFSDTREEKRPAEDRDPKQVGRLDVLDLFYVRRILCGKSWMVGNK